MMSFVTHFPEGGQNPSNIAASLRALCFPDILEALAEILPASLKQSFSTSSACGITVSSSDQSTLDCQHHDSMEASRGRESLAPAHEFADTVVASVGLGQPQVKKFRSLVAVVTANLTTAVVTSDLACDEATTCTACGRHSVLPFAAPCQHMCCYDCWKSLFAAVTGARAKCPNIG